MKTQPKTSREARDQARAAIAAMRAAALSNLPSRFAALRAELASGLRS